MLEAESAGGCVLLSQVVGESPHLVERHNVHLTTSNGQQLTEDLAWGA